ncbi:hypothetical protein [Corallococcus exercitus]|uniref:Uncharacterized protein n=1 Tax=Corallococcus exercitus TaxID=2316736 RepID=A0A7Y4JX90_9BACT|nr:hypothetical protein [Corallococcus exercitus]NOK12800.1 hypothetical protein [Corallococcus exercitus]
MARRSQELPLGLIHDDLLGTGTCRTEESSWPDLFPRDVFTLGLTPDLALTSRDARGEGLERCWYSGTLRSLKEASLLPPVPGIEVYRFTWMPPFHASVVIRVEQRGPVHSLHVKMTGKERGPLAVDRRILLTPTQWQAIQQRLEKTRFWIMDRFFAPRPVEYVDGAYWLFEGVREERYRVIDILSPDTDGPARAYYDLGALLVELSGITLASGELY